ncbi:HAD-IIB family hydrolase [Roseateles depolymerans]|nr:HAD-IIB family hydrolase [Roseateles depolymerans]
MSCPREEWRAVVGVLTDIDDTLTTGGGLGASARQALERLAAAGLPVIAITGRPAGWSEPMARDWAVCGIVAENGGVLLTRQRVKGASPEPSPAPLIVEFSQDADTRARNALRLKQCADEILARVPGATLATDSAGRLTDIAIDHSEHAHLPPQAIEAVCAVMQAHGLHATVSSIHINGWIGTHSKWTAAEWAVPRLTGMAFDPRRWLYVGDSSNDQLMFERMPFTVAVANIERFLPVLTHLPRYVTRAERGEGFAEVVQAMLEAREASEAREVTDTGPSCQA